jgi:aryl-alcohol dehydrogenase-like predicted oxidoreductase
MKTRSIGSLEVSLVGLGCNNFGGRTGAEESEKVIRAAVDAGITLFDTADMYSEGRSEEILGRALKGVRDQVVIATKFAAPMTDGGGASPAWINRAVEDSLRRLQTDHIDLYQQHFPDDAVPIEETLGALNELVEAGKVREIGCSNFSAALIDEAADVSARRGWARLACTQEHHSLLEREVEATVIPAARRHDMAELPYFPLANGLLTGKYRRGQEPPAGTRLATAAPERRNTVLSDRNLAMVEALETLCREHHHSLLELAFAWLAAQPPVASVIAGATRPEQVAANVKAVDWELDESVLAEIDAITAAHY